VLQYDIGADKRGRTARPLSATSPSLLDAPSLRDVAFSTTEGTVSGRGLFLSARVITPTILLSIDDAVYVRGATPTEEQRPTAVLDGPNFFDLSASMARFGNTASVAADEPLLSAHNCEFFFAGRDQDTRLFLRTCRPIAAGDELLIS
jgi:hypothetical protein